MNQIRRLSSVPPAMGLAPATAVVRVHGRRVSWTRTPEWNPEDPAFGGIYVRAKVLGLAGTARERPLDTIRGLLQTDTPAVLVYGLPYRTVAYVTRPTPTGELRAAWSRTGIWPPTDSALSAEYRAAHAAGLAGIEWTWSGLERIIRGRVPGRRT